MTFVYLTARLTLHGGLAAFANGRTSRLNTSGSESRWRSDVRDRHARFARPGKGPAARRAVPSGGGVARSSSAGLRTTNAGRGATGFLRPPRTRASSVARVLSEPPARAALGLALPSPPGCGPA